MELLRGVCSAQHCRGGAAAAPGSSPGCLEPEPAAASAGLWWRAANVTCLAPSQSGEEDRRRMCTAELCQEALLVPSVSVLAQLVQSKPCQAGRPKPWGCPPSRHLAALPTVGMLLLPAVFTGLLASASCFQCRWNGAAGGAVREEIAPVGGCVPIPVLHWFHWPKPWEQSSSLQHSLQVD